MAAGDPRLSLEERYKNHDGYVKAVAKAAEKLEKRRFLLPADVQKYIDEAAGERRASVTGRAARPPAGLDTGTPILRDRAFSSSHPVPRSMTH